MCVYFNLLLTVFNLLPIPPLDGSRVMTWLLPAGLREPYVALERFGLILVVILVLTVPPVQRHAERRGRRADGVRWTL